MAGVFPMDDVVLEGCETTNGHDTFSDDDCIEVTHQAYIFLFNLFMSSHSRLRKVFMQRDQILPG